MSKVPSPPYRYLSGNDGNVSLDLSALDVIISDEDVKNQSAYDLGSQIKKVLVQSRASYELALPQEERDAIRTKLDELIEQAMPENEKVPRKGNLSFIFGDYVRLRAYWHFLATGALLPQSSISDKLSDEEYLTGIIMLNQDIARYAIGRATERDVKSVVLASDLVSSVLDHLMKYDFRNGNLRRKYDGVKYALKTTETVLYELSVTGADVDVDGTGKGEPKAKKARTETATTDEASSNEEFTLLPDDELESLRKRMDHRDELRETLIKKCRDGQKAAKQAIYALHRNDIKKASKLISDCETCILKDLTPIVEEEPMLRYGSYANVMEEYAEAKLYFVWLFGDGGVNDISNKDKPNGKILLPNDFTTIPLQPEDYIGGLCDLTGEIGRFAVKKGTQRDADNVKFCLETDMSILYALQSLSRLPGKNIGKKMDPLRRSVEKLEKMLYELSLVKATGRNIVSEANESGPDEPSNSM